MEPVLGEGEPEGLGHLAFRFLPCPGVGHRKAERDAVGRQEDVRSLLPACGLRRPVHVRPHCRVEIEGKDPVVLHERLQVRRGAFGTGSPEAHPGIRTSKVARPITCSTLP